MEVWKTITEYPNYEISNYGYVRNVKTRKVLKNLNRKLGYKYVDLYKKKGSRKMSIQRLVANAFIENPFNKPVVNHIDSNPENNHVDNLEWATHQENVRHAFNEKRRVGNKSNLGRFLGDAWKARPIMAISKEGILTEFSCAKEASIILKMDNSSICKVLKGIKPHVKKYKFQYK